MTESAQAGTCWQPAVTMSRFMQVRRPVVALNVAICNDIVVDELRTLLDRHRVRFGRGGPSRDATKSLCTEYKKRDRPRDFFKIGKVCLLETGS